MKPVILAIIMFITGMTSLPAQSIQQYGKIGNLVLTSGDTLYDCTVGYRTFGKMSPERDNIVVYVTFFGGTSAHLGNLTGKGKIVDTTDYFVIAIDALGNGISTSPSNYGKTSFPRITIRDMVNSQYILLTQILGIESIYCLIGGSMGGMQAFEWINSYPEYMECAISYLSTPQLTSYDLLSSNALLRALMIGKEGCVPERELQQIRDIFISLNAQTPEYRLGKTKREDFQKFWSGFMARPGDQTFTAENTITQTQAMLSMDIIGDRTFEEAAKRIKARLFIIVSATDHIVNPTPGIEFAAVMKCRLLVLENNCGHGAVSCEMERVSKEIADFLKK
ncbi:MAG: alpha/beta fold hydrolase [Ignavibacteriaceae bacterium]